MKYKVLHHFSYGWDDAGWSNTYNTIGEAQDEIEDLIETVKDAVKKGDMSEAYDLEDYKIVEADTNEEVYDYIVGCSI